MSQYMSIMLEAISAPYINQYADYVPVALVILPSAILLLFSKGRHRRIIARGVHAAVYAVAGLVFVIAAPSTPVSLSGNFPLITHNIGIVMTALIAMATLETTFGEASKKKAVEEPKK